MPRNSREYDRMYYEKNKKKILRRQKSKRYSYDRDYYKRHRLEILAKKKAKRDALLGLTPIQPLDVSSSSDTQNLTP